MLTSGSFQTGSAPQIEKIWHGWAFPATDLHIITISITLSKPTGANSAPGFNLHGLLIYSVQCAIAGTPDLPFKKAPTENI